MTPAVAQVLHAGNRRRKRRHPHLRRALGGRDKLEAGPKTSSALWATRVLGMRWLLWPP